MSTDAIQLHRALRASPERVYRAFLDADAVMKCLADLSHLLGGLDARSRDFA